MSLSAKNTLEHRTPRAPVPPAKADAAPLPKKTPPHALIKSWLWMAYMCKDDIIKAQGVRNLKRVFGSCKQAIAYMEKQQGK
jgi:hypothetical protein